MYYFVIATAIGVVFTGLTTFVLGDWTHLKLKHAALVLSLIASMWMMVEIFTYPLSYQCNMEERVCFTFGVYSVMRNIAFMIFHIAVGRDAIHIKNRERRRV